MNASLRHCRHARRDGAMAMRNLFQLAGLTALFSLVACSGADSSGDDSASSMVTNSFSSIVSAIGNRCLDDYADLGLIRIRRHSNA